MHEWLDHNDLLQSIPSQPSQYLDLCENNVEITHKLRKFIPSKQQTYEDPVFRSFVRANQTQVPIPDYLWNHSSQSKEAWQKAIAKYYRKLPCVERDEDLNLAEEWLHECLRGLVAPCSPKSMIHVTQHSSMDASPGPLFRNVVNCKAMFLDHPDSKYYLDEYLLASLFPGGISTLWGCQLKDELRLQSKVLENKTRLFIMAPTEHFMLSQILSLDFNEQVIANARCMRGPILVGMPTTAVYFDALGNRMSRCSVRTCADVSGFDTSVPNVLLEMCMWLRFSLMKKRYRTFETACQFANMYRDVIWTPVMLPDGTVCLFPGEPSGTGNTAQDNSLILLVSLFYCWLKNGGPRHYDSFVQMVYDVVFGDDSMVGTSFEGGKYIGPGPMKYAFSLLGFELEFSECLEFLGHFIVRDTSLNRYVPLFPYHKVIASLIYNGNGSDLLSLLSKPFNLRMLSWSDPRAWELLEKYCEFIFESYPQYRAQLSSMYKTRDEILEIQGLGPRLNNKAQTISLSNEIVKHCPMQVNAQANQKRRQKKGKGKKEVIVVSPQKAGPVLEMVTVPSKRRRRNRLSKKMSNMSLVEATNFQLQSGKRQHYNSGIPRQLLSQPMISDMYRGFIAAMLNPIEYERNARFPDAFAKETALITDECVFSIPLNFPNVGTPDDGRFCVAFQPNFGTVSTQQRAFDTWRGFVVDATSGWPTDFSVPASYHQQLGSTPLNWCQTTMPLLQPALGYAEVQCSNFLNTNPLGNTFVITDINLGLQIGVSGTASNTITAPPGVYLVSLSTESTAATLTNPYTWTPGNANGLTPGGQIYHQYTLFFGSATIPQVNLEVVQLSFVNPGDFWTVTSPQVTSPVTANFAMSPCFTDKLSDSWNSGNVIQARPVQQSMLVHYSGPRQWAGGNLSACRLSGSALQKLFLLQQPDATAGNIQNWEQLAKQNGAVPLEDPLKGAYLTWVPEDLTQCSFNPPDQMNNLDYPFLVVAGQINAVGAASSIPTNPSWIRVTVITRWEVQTTSPLIDVESCPGDTAEFERCISLLNRLPMAVQNEQHKAFVSNVLSKLKNWGGSLMSFLENNKDWIVPLSKVAGKAAMSALV